MPYSLQTTGKVSMHGLQTHSAPWPAALDDGSTRSISAPCPRHILSFPTEMEPSKAWGSGMPSARWKEKQFPREGEHTNYEKWIFPIKQDKAEVCNVIPRHHWRKGEIWGGNSRFLSHRICAVQWSLHLICQRLMSCSHQDLGELELQLCQWWDWGGEEAFGGLGTANFSS